MGLSRSCHRNSNCSRIARPGESIVMNRSTAIVAFACSFVFLTGPAPAGSGIGKGSVAPFSELSAAGTVASVYPESMSFSCQCESGTWTFETSAGTLIRKGAAAATFADIEPGASVQIQYHFAAGGVVTDQVVVAP
jgi:hypothetical protein